LLILDASYSMGETLDEGQTKMAVAKRALLDTLAKLPPNTAVGLRVYGISSNPLSACTASKLVVPIGTNNRAVIASHLLGLRPTGETPISFSLQQAIQLDLLNRQGPKAVVLVTDGMETCDADPCRVAVQLVRNGSQVKIHTIALGLARDYDALRQLKCISAATYGRFHSASTYGELLKGLANSVEIRTRVDAQIITKP
jgi:Ca-activated chloride channel family protein